MAYDWSQYPGGEAAYRADYDQSFYTGSPPPPLPPLLGGSTSPTQATGLSSGGGGMIPWDQFTSLANFNTQTAPTGLSSGSGGMIPWEQFVAAANLGSMPSSAPTVPSGLSPGGGGTIPWDQFTGGTPQTPPGTQPPPPTGGGGTPPPGGGGGLPPGTGPGQYPWDFYPPPPGGGKAYPADSVSKPYIPEYPGMLYDGIYFPEIMYGNTFHMLQSGLDARFGWPTIGMPQDMYYRPPIYRPQTHGLSFNVQPGAPPAGSSGASAGDGAMTLNDWYAQMRTLGLIN